MANWAVVIGIDEYWKETVCLKGAVGDALRMREWLLDPAGGNVPDRNLFLVLGPRPGRPVPAGIDHQPATKDRIVEVINRLWQKSGGEGERLFVFFAGHGLSMRVALNKYEHALIASDFNYVLADKSLEVGSLLAFFKSTAFQDQFFFLDACRNLPDDEFEIGRMPNPPKRDFTKPEPQQFVMYATSPGVKAQERKFEAGEGGVFTDALLAGLRGEGRAKRYDANRDLHVVRWDALFDHVKRAIEARKIGFGEGSHLIQVPREAGERGVAGRSADPELAVLDPATFAAEPLRIVLEPDAVVPSALVSVIDPSDPLSATSLGGLAGQPDPLPLPPRPYAVAAQAKGFRAKRRSWLVELYAPSEVRVDFDEDPDAPAPGPRGPTRGPGGGSGSGGPHFRPKPLYGSIHARTADPLAIVEILDLSGKVLASGHGRVELADRPPGLYVARVRTLSGHSRDDTIELPPGETVEVDLAPPPTETTPLLLDTMNASGIFIDGNDGLRVSEALDGIAAGDMGTVLTLSAIRATFGDAISWGHRLGGVGLRNVGHLFPADVPSAIYIACADELRAPGGTSRLAAFEIGVFKDGRQLSGGPVDLLGVPGIGEAGLGVDAGLHHVRLSAPEQPLVDLVVHALPRHMTLLVIHGREDGEILILEHSVPLDVGDDPALLVEARDIDLLQRSLLYDRPGLAGDPERLVRARQPVGRLIGCDLALRSGNVALSEAVAGDLAGVFPLWSDPLVVRGETALARADEAGAIDAYRRALALGPPGYAPLLARLSVAAQRHELEGEGRAALDAAVGRRVPGVLWTAFRHDD